MFVLLLKAACNKNGITMKDLSEKTGYSLVSIYRWEKGLRSPNAKALKALANVLDCTIDELLRDDSPNPTAPAEGTPAKEL